MTEISVHCYASMSEIEAKDWDQLHGSSHPFIQHAFLKTLETCGCVGEHYGWLPRHLVIYKMNRLVAALPLYEKHNNYGEFVFDQAWSQAWQSVGLNYYPKLVSAIPYTPARGPRLLVALDLPDSEQQALRQQLLLAAQSLAHQLDYSGVHILFAQSEDQLVIQRADDWLVRHDCQFHWPNQGYETFDDFLAQLKPKKRKNIRQERKAIEQAGIRFRVLNGLNASEQDWADFSHFYQKTFIDKWGTPTLNQAFFQAIAQAMPEKVVLVLANDPGGRCIAGALMFRSDSVLYGRHWGCIESVKHLHFETCFYQGIEYAITQGLERFEPGAGGEHKIARGFVPVAMQSSHWLKSNPFVEGIDEFIEQEKAMIDNYMQQAEQQVPYRLGDKRR